MVLTGGALERLEDLTPDGMTAQIDLTITDDFPLAQAIVIISALPEMWIKDQAQELVSTKAPSMVMAEE